MLIWSHILLKNDNMNFCHIPIIISIICGLSACTSDENYYLKTNYKLITDHVQEERIVGSVVPGSDNYDAIKIFACDTLCLFYSWMNPNGFFSILNIKNGQELGTYCPKGNGPQETTGMDPIFEVYNERGTLKAEIIDIHRDRIFVWNITESVKTKKTIYDTIRPFNRLSRYACSYNWCFRLNDSQYFTCTSSIPFEDINQVVTPKYAITSSLDNQLMRDYQIYTDSIITVPGNRKWILSNFVSMECCMKPDKSKVALGMSYYPQVNILDLKSGDLKCYRLKNSPSISILKRIWYYASICCDDRYIYGLYNAQDLSQPRNESSVSVIHVYDWNGRIIRKLALDQLFDQICLDDNIIYAFDRRGKIIRYDINTIMD